MNLEGIHPILVALMENQIPFTITPQGIKVEGFYKSGEVTLVPHMEGDPLINPRSYTVKSRYNTEDVAEDFDDLVAINFDWWQRSCDRDKAWKEPNPLWAELLIEAGYVHRVTREFIELTPVYSNLK